MSQPPVFYPAAPPQPVRAPQPTPKRGPGLLLIVGAASGVAGIALGIAISAGTTDSATPAPAPTVTVTRTAQASAPRTEPAPSPASKFNAKPADFQISLKVLKKECFGDSGCNYTYRIVPDYVGTEPLPTSGTVEVSYRVTGDEGGPIDNTFTIENGTASFDNEESASTNRNSIKLAVKATDVSYTE